ncbi:MAG: SDR family oxidoreductase [Bdellovibrionales bacterium]|nr:SDR family oxidoreductase [Bdellovibrionales bacterium]
MEILISGASTGIGKACAVHMARLGHNVWASVRSQKSFDEITRLNVKGVQPLFLDVTDENSVREGLSTVIKKAGTLHGLVNNAGIAVGGPIEGVTLDDWRRQFETNVIGLVSLTQAALPLLRESKGRIINMSSISGRFAAPFMGPYSASKHAVEAISDSLRREMVPFGVHVAIIEPGAIATPIWDKARTEGMEKSAKFSSAVSAAYGARLEKFRLRIEEITRQAAPMSVVTGAVEHALTSPRPRTRYPVGKGIKTLAILTRVLPDPWLDRISR